MFSRLRPFLFLAAMGLLFFGDLVLQPGQVLYSDHSDLLAMHLPLKRFLVRSWQQTGEIPLWCPYSFAGVPLIHDVQIAAFYPLHWPLYLLPEERIGAAMSWLVVLHVLIAGWCMAAYALSQEFGRTAAVVAGVGYMFAGKWLLHVLAGGHYIMIPLAWLPLVLLCLERAIQRRSLPWATGAGGIFALIVLGTHPQMTLYAGLFIALWSLGCWGTIGNQAPTLTFWRFLGRWGSFGVWAALVAVGLSAVQLLPAIEAAQESTRAVGVPARDILAAAAPTSLNLVGPGWSAGWEDRAALAVLWIAAAAMAAVLGGRQARFQAGVGGLLLLFALGGAAFLQWLPGFRFFQLPGRMLMVLAFPVAFLAARATQILLDDKPLASPTASRCRKMLLRVSALSLLLAATSAFVNYVAWSREAMESPSRDVLDWLRQLPAGALTYWVCFALTMPAAYWLLGDRSMLRSSAWSCAWVGVLAIDAAGLAYPQVAVRSETELYRPSTCIRYLIEQKAREGKERWRVLDRPLAGLPSSSPLGPALPLLGSVGLEPVLGYNSFDIRRTKEYLQLITGEDKPVRPREGIFGYPMVGAFPIKNKPLLDLLGVRFLLQPDNSCPDLDGSCAPYGTGCWQKVGEDPSPAAYSFLAGGVRDLPTYRIFANPDVFPRAFLVGKATELLPTSVLRQLRTTNLHDRVLLEGPVSRRAGDGSCATQPGEAIIREYTPNRVRLDVQGATPGYLVLTDVWFPGWTCTVDGEPASVRRADFLFRAVSVPAGQHEVIFTFAPASYRWGKYLSILTLAVVIVIWIGRLVCPLPRISAIPWTQSVDSTPHRANRGL